MNKLVVCLALALASVGAVAGEGMWTPDNLPKARVQANHGFTPDAKWAEHVQKAALRSLVQAAARDLAPQGIHCATITIHGVLGTSEVFDPAHIADVYAELVTETAGPREHWRTVVDYPDR